MSTYFMERSNYHEQFWVSNGLDRDQVSINLIKYLMELKLLSWSLYFQISCKTFFYSSQFTREKQQSKRTLKTLILFALMMMMMIKEHRFRLLAIFQLTQHRQNNKLLDLGHKTSNKDKTRRTTVLTFCIDSSTLVNTNPISSINLSNHWLSSTPPIFFDLT